MHAINCIILGGVNDWHSVKLQATFVLDSSLNTERRRQCSIRLIVSEYSTFSDTAQWAVRSSTTETIVVSRQVSRHLILN